MLSVIQATKIAPQVGCRFVRFDRLAPDFGITYSRMHIGRLERAGKFPKRVHLGANSVVWVEAEIVEWQAERIAAR